MIDATAPLIPGGFAKSWRKELQSDVWLMPPIYHRVWYWLRLNVQHETFLFPTQGKLGIWVLPGQRITSLRQIAEGVAWKEWGVEKFPNVKTIKAVLDWLEAQEMVTVESNAKGTLITLINWHTYNSHPPEEVTHKGNSERITDGTRSGYKEEGYRRNINKKTLSAKNPPAGFTLFRDWWMYAFSCMEGDRYIFEQGKDGKCLTSMLMAADWKEIVCKACHYLVDTDRFPKGRPTISGLKTSINKYPGHINGRGDHFRDLGLIPPDNVLLEKWTPWKESRLTA